MWSRETGNCDSTREVFGLVRMKRNYQECVVEYVVKVAVERKEVTMKNLLGARYEAA